MAVISVSLPESLLDQADALIESRGYAGRSELVRASLRDYIQREADPEEEGHRTATLTVVYPHGVERKVSSVRHDFDHIVQSMMHGHSEGACVEVFMLKGQASEVRSFMDGFRGIREVQAVDVTFTDVPGLVAEHEHR